MTIFEDFISTTDLAAKKTILTSHPEILTETNAKGQTLLHLATLKGDVTEIELLLLGGASVKSQDNNGRSCLHYAVQQKNSELVKLFASYKEALNLSDSAKWTPLHLAALKGFDEIGCILTKAGADISAKAEKGRTYEKVAANPSFIKAVLQAQSDLSSEELARQLGQEELSRALEKTDESLFLKVAEQFTADLPPIGLYEDTDPC